MAADTEVVLVAAGLGRRMGAPEPKAFLSLNGHPLFTYAVRVFSKIQEIAGIVLVVPAGFEEQIQVLCRQSPDLARIRAVAAGGARRQDSVQNGLDRLLPETQWVLIHDAARPLVSVALIQRVLQATQAAGAAIPGIPVTDTLKRIGPEGLVESTVDRRRLNAVQTPQGFNRQLLEKAYRHAWETNHSVTDDASLLELMGIPVAVVEGDPTNFKLTRPQDLHLAEVLLRRSAVAEKNAFGDEPVFPEGLER